MLVGGAGIMNYVGKLRDMMPSGAKVSAVCDGCVLFDDLPSSSQVSSCSDAFACPPEETLPKAVNLWKASLDDACGGWRCLLSTRALGQSGAVARAAKELPLLAQHPLYDATIFSARGLAPKDNASFAAEVRSRVKAGLAFAKVTVASACTSPQSSFTKHQFFSVQFGGGLPPTSYATALYGLVYDSPSKLEDSCIGVDCNPDCQSSSARGAEVLFT